ncbi:hypothetical protein GCM10008903_31760 [Clostridium cadaveris]
MITALNTKKAHQKIINSRLVTNPIKSQQSLYIIKIIGTISFTYLKNRYHVHKISKNFDGSLSFRHINSLLIKGIQKICFINRPKLSYTNLQ